MKKNVRWIVDVAMAVLLLVLMARQLTGDRAHEWLGAGMFVLWILHHLLNLRWWTHLTKGRYSLLRTLSLLINLALFAAMLTTMVSGIILSREVFAFLDIHGGRALARSAHIAASFWSFVLMGAHLGLHWGMVLAQVRKVGGKEMGKNGRWALCILAAVMGLYGIRALLVHQIPSYLFLSASFVFFDFTQPPILFFVDHLCIFALFVLVFDCLRRGTNRGVRKRTGE